MQSTNDILKSLRESGMSQSEIARRTGIPQPRISRWERGAPPVGADDALKLAQLWRELRPDARPELAAEAQP